METARPTTGSNDIFLHSLAFLPLVFSYWGGGVGGWEWISSAYLPLYLAVNPVS